MATTRVEELVGREEELAAIDAFLDRAAAGPAALLIEGEAGIGKTALWATGVERARERGFRVLLARPAEAERALSFAALSDVLADVHDEIARLPLPQRRPLAAALLLEDADGIPAEPRAIAMGLLTLLRELARERPLVVAVDDVQWIDPPSALALSFALRRATEGPIHAVLAERTGGAGGSGIDLGSAVEVERLVIGPVSLGAFR